MTDAEDILAAAKRFMVRWHEEEKEEEEEEKEKEEEAEEAEKRVGSATYPSWVAVKGNEGRGGPTTAGKNRGWTKQERRRQTG